MANVEHLAILKMGVYEWNNWRSTDYRITPDLSFADLRGMDLTGANLADTYLFRADFSGATLDHVNFAYAVLTLAKLSNCPMNHTYFYRCDLSEAILRGLDFSKCQFGGVIFAFTDLSSCSGFENIMVESPCVIDFDTLYASPNLPKEFLQKIGMPDVVIDSLPSYYDQIPTFYPVFLSHSSKNKKFVRKLNDALSDRKIRTFLDEKEIRPGENLFEKISQGIGQYDKMILVCSRQSLERSWWVDREIDRVLKKEIDLFTDTGKRHHLLVPITIDDYIFKWDGAKKSEVLRYKVCDFKKWKDEAAFEKSLNELVAALQVNRPEIPPPSYIKRKKE